jgi:cysteine synthase A
VGEARIDRRPGTAVRAPESATDRLGHVIVSGPDRARVLRDLEAALATVEIVVDDR